MADLAFINPKILNWARARAQVSEDDLSKALGVKPEKVIAWAEGSVQPTFNQAQKLAGKLHIPFAFFFLPSPPRDELPLPDLRTVANRGVAEASINLKDTIASVMRRQAWYKEYLQDQGAAPLDFVGSVTPETSPSVVASAIRKTLKLDNLDPRGMNWESYQRKIVTAAENAGVLVMRSGIVDNNTHRTLSISEFRGFAVSDPLAPVIFINLRDAPAARLFTLIHEIAHLWLGQSGISSAKPSETRREEQFCNAVAGEFLAPAKEMSALWRENAGLEENVADLSRIFHVSKYVIVRRALDLKLIGQETYQTYYGELIRQFNDTDSSGGNFYVMAQNKNSAKFSKALLGEALTGRVLLRDASRLLGIAPAKLKTYADEVGA
jgi:Zn-dependent peptidase ImmA (M78 family)/DNA-binding XRE family transcriptional regulator